jgi:hypothetical protein
MEVEGSDDGDQDGGQGGGNDDGVGDTNEEGNSDDEEMEQVEAGATAHQADAGPAADASSQNGWSYYVVDG